MHALIAHTNRAGEKQLRLLELRLLAAGITVARTADDLARYHDKLLIIDERVLFVLSFNFTRQDVGRAAQHGVATRKRRLVAEALRLFEADATRQPFDASAPDLVISPLNARARLTKLLKAARRSLWIYDPQAIDTPLLRMLKERAGGGRRRARDRQGRARGQATCARTRRRPCGCTCARSCATTSSSSSAARVCAGSSSTGAARSA